ncbi:DNA-3-methyladenine glycosylase [Nocardioides sp. Bht2]|uniref:DNA-3-methyladenine glycosylase n=1 Tax=Nocardioides sp. Bht2 TaxID=3392297 RepID=UPI0039B510DA
MVGSADFDFLSRGAVEAAPRLLGCLLVHDTADGTVALRITEVEAYAGTDDPASHSFRGPRPSNLVMFGPPGHLYVYRSHGIHWCGNVVADLDGVASGLLLRAGEIVEGRDIAQRRRGERVTERDLARGPGRLGQALGITGADGGTPLTTGGPLRLELGTPVRPTRVRRGPRVGVSRAADVPWRFWIDAEPSVSAYRRSPRAE